MTGMFPEGSLHNGPTGFGRNVLNGMGLFCKKEEEKKAEHRKQLNEWQGREP